jgi:hypothetical protein
VHFAYVVIQIAEQGAAVLAVGAAVRFLTGVYQIVVAQFAQRVEIFTAMLARE